MVPTAASHTSTATFKFAGGEGAGPLTFESKLDKKKFKRCTSPKKYKKLHLGKHKFKVRAIDESGTVDPTPTRKRFRIRD